MVVVVAIEHVAVVAELDLDALPAAVARVAALFNTREKCPGLLARSGPDRQVRSSA
jgi:hypothetical protein